MGPSGCGKTTTLKMINRLIEPTGGRILLDDVNVLEQDPVRLRRGIGYVIQHTGLMPHRTVRQNVATVPKLLDWDDDRIAARTQELTEILDLAPDLLDRYPAELSGGQSQRVGVARALAADPPVMLMDEPFAAVDPIVRSRLQDQFLDIQARLRKTIVFVTHDVDEAIKLSDRMAILNVGRRPGAVRACGGDPAGACERLRARVRRRGAGVEAPCPDPGRRPAYRGGTGRGSRRHRGAGASRDRSAPASDGRASWTMANCWAGWTRDALEGCDTVAEARTRPFTAYVTARDSLRTALDSIVTSRTGVAVVATPRVSATAES